MNPPSAERKRSLEKAVMSFELALRTDEKALAYLHGRGLSTEIIQSFRLGVVKDPEPEFEMYNGMIAIPYITLTGIVSIKFRQAHKCEGCKHAKYLSLVGSDMHLYNVGAATKGAVLGLTEGEFDSQVGELCRVPCMGIPGVKAWRGNPHWARILEGKDILMFADPDGPGMELAQEVLQSVHSARIVRLPADLNDTFLQHGAGEIRRRAGLQG